MKNPFTIHYSLFTLLLATVTGVHSPAQNTLDAVLSQISKNNKTILANTQYWEAQKLQFKTGLTPYNPSVNYDFLLGSPNTAGNQNDFTITQSFDFPTAYAKKKQLSGQKIAQAEFHLISKKQEILLEAKIICIELVYRNKLHLQLSQRKQDAEKLLRDFQTRLNKGDGNILEVNKAQLQLIEINKEFQQNLSTLNQLNQKLNGLNGGNAIIFTDTIYPLLIIIPPFDQLEKEIEASDPVRKFLEQEKLVTQKQVELSKALTLPKFETGYHYQGILGQTFQGVHAGITIPLWENKNTVKTQKANLLFSDLNLQDYLNENYYRIKQLYEKYQNLKITLEEYESLIASFNNTMLLNKALASGQISTIEYFIEIHYHYTAFNNFLETEKEYYKVIAELYKYQL